MAKKTTGKPSPAPIMQIVALDDFKKDKKNANLHSKQGEELLAESMSSDGFARPVFASADKTILGGNLTTAVAKKLGMNKAIVVYSDGTLPIVHVRRDIKSANTRKARKLALGDNRIGEVSLVWDNDVLSQLEAEHSGILQGLWQNIPGITGNPEGLEFREVTQNSLSQKVKTNEIACPHCGKTFKHSQF